MASAGMGRSRPASSARTETRTYAAAVVLLLFLFLPCGPANPEITRAQGSDSAFDDTLDRAQLAMKRRNYEDAVKFFKRANSMKGDKCAECLWGMAQAYNRLGARKNVIETCDRLLQVTSETPLIAQTHNLKGITFSAMATERLEKMDEKKLREAEACFRKALETNRDLFIARMNLGITLIRLKQEAEGIKELKDYAGNADEESESTEEARKIIDNPRRVRENYAPDFSLTTSEGEFLSSDDLRGKVVLVDFWGTWCPPCVESVPSLVHLNKKFSKDPFVLISISSDNDHDRWQEFILKNKMTWPQFLDMRDKIQRSFQVQSFPTYVLVDGEGIIRYRSSGYSMYSERELEDAVKKSLKALAKLAAQPRPAAATAAPPPTPARATEPEKTQAASPVQSAQGAAHAPASVHAAPTAAPSPGAAEKGEALPVPVVEIASTSPMEAGGVKLLRFALALKNWQEYSDALFAPAPDLPPCFMGGTPTRMQITVLRQDGSQLVSYCSVQGPPALRQIWVVVREGDTESMNVYLSVEDRSSKRTAKSERISLSIPAPKKED